MCGRYSLSVNPPAIQLRFHLAEPVLPAPRSEFSLPRYNVAPTQDILIVRLTAAGERIGAWTRWGLVPPSAKDLSGGAKMINARKETLFDKVVFKTPIRLRRCLIPSDGFFEWKAVGKQKQPYRFMRKDGSIFAMAGIWSRWRGPDGSVVDTASIITCPPNQLVEPFHDRMPVILADDSFPLWLDPALETREPLEHLLVPCPANDLVAVPVSRTVNDVKRDDPSCLEQVPPLEPKEQLGFDF
jgi:putative SOS response-associated peptidase YedK